MAITANAQGEIKGKFTIPENIPAGTKLVEFSGDTTEATATFVGRGVITVEDLRVVTTQINRRLLTWKGDPLAQTFSLAERLQIAAVDLWFTAIGTTNILVQIREVELGLPAPIVLAEALLTPAEVTVNDWTRFTFTPTMLEAERDYAVIIACNDATAAVAVAGIGEWDADAEQWVTAQPYQIGVLLSSSNNRTWTPHQTHDLTFRLLACDYNVVGNDRQNGVATKTVALTSQTVTDADHLVVLAAVERPTPDCDVIFNVTVDDQVYTVMEDQSFTLAERYTGTVDLEAVLIGTYTASPVLHPDVHLVAGTRLTECDYITRAMQTNIGLSPTVTLTAYFDVVRPGSASVTAYYEASESVWAELPVISSTPLGNEWVEIKCVVDDFTGLDTRLKLTLAGTAWEQPQVKNLRVVFT
jgi:hypothetical protein